MEADAHCPYCAVALSLVIDESGGRRQQYVEDCWVCCQPIEVQVVLNEDAEGDEERWRINVRQSDG
jgi:hypothetical protein